MQDELTRPHTPEEIERALRESEERYRAFIANSSEGIWRFELERPVPTDLPEDEQIERFYRDCYLAECNDAAARMYGFERAEEIVGGRLGRFLVREDPSNVEYLRAFIRSGYRLTDAESVEVDREGRRRYFLNNLVGAVRDGRVLRAWGTQRDVTERRRVEQELEATEHRFSMFMENLPGLAWIKDLEGRYVYANEAAARAFRVPREELKGKTDAEIFPPETAAQFRENDRRALEAGGVLTLERLEHPDGVHHSIVSKFPMPGRDGQTLLVGGVAIDVTERIRAEEALRESEQKYRSLLENANDIIYSHDLEGNYLTINRAGSEATGYTREEILGGLNIAQVVAPEHLELARRMTAEKLRDPSRPTIYEVDIIARDGRRLTLEVSTRIAYSDGRPVAVEGIARDVTERVRAAQERERLLAEARAARDEAEEALERRRDVEERLRTLVDASASLLGSPQTEVVLPAVLALSHRLVAADAYAIWRYQEQEKVWAVVAASGLSDEYSRDRIPVTTQTPHMPDRPLVVEDVFADPMLEVRREFYRREGVRSMLTLPLSAHGETIGTLVFYYREPRRFAHTDVVVATALANLAASAVRTAELYDEQRRLRGEAEAAERRAVFLAEASTLLSSSLDYEKTLEAVAHAAVPWVADWCGVDILGDDGEVRRLAVAHVDPEKVEWAREIQERYPYDPDAPNGVPEVLRTGRAELYQVISDELLVAAAKDEEHLRFMREIGFNSAMIVPLAAHGRAFGAITFVTAESGRRYGTEDLAFAEDLARRASLAVENARLYGQAQEANRIKDEFLATLSHELRTPLTAILGWASMLSAGTLDAREASRAVAAIERNARAQRQIVEDVLDVSRVITGKLRLEMRAVELRALVQDAVESVRPAAEAKGVYLSTLLAPDAGEVTADPNRLQQVMWNLLSNAVKFTPAGGRVEVDLRRDGARTVLRVSDTGEGIAPEFLPHVFDRFRQADMGTTRQHGGLGLGLAIVRHLVELHGGEVKAESRGRGLGSTFTLRLPIRTSPRVEVTSRPAAVKDAPAAAAVTANPSPLAGTRVLLVEDEEDARAMLKALLAGLGASVEAVGSAAEAWAALEGAGCDVLLSDIGMPEEDGYALVGRVRGHAAERVKRTPAVALTAYAREDDRERALAAGFDAFLPKPVEPSELAEVLVGLLKRPA
ncbi:MAG TPA: PAS domain S-box protein [Pyrinomonadaceae bacterium]|nr:PAS domain S-box protein [Pyrinomonadaceae bacterium]